MRAGYGGRHTATPTYPNGKPSVHPGNRVPDGLAR